jgi:predicted dehydrogenase/threonine dehydrogenase-like Zn-dependent dehydrogenase
MRQVFQSLRDGETAVVDVPAPKVAPGHVLIRTRASVISAGTERMLVEFGQANLLEKARQQPEKVKEVLDKLTTDGLLPTVQAVRSKLGQPIPLGYANAGRVVAVGHDVDDLTPGDEVASNGPHAEVVSVPRNLVVPLPKAADGGAVAPEHAAFAPIGAIALQGVRLAQPTLGERFVVTGVGLIGLLAVQLLRAHGCQVLAVDLDPQRLALAESFGAVTVDVSAGVDPVAAAASYTDGEGVDGVIVAAATRSSDPIHQAAQVCRKRGRVVLVGVTGLELQRTDFYEKELSFQVSCSYGPGRYDSAYEEKGLDYPLGFVRWTAGRNFDAFLQLVADGRIQLDPLISHRFPLEDAATAYEKVSDGGDVLGVVLTYPDHDGATDDAVLAPRVTVGDRGPALPGSARAAVIGAGNYARQVLLPALAETDAVLDTIVSRSGATAAQAARKFGFGRATSELDEVFEDGSIDTVIVATRHDTHAELALRALRTGKHVFVEKPLALRREELDEIADLLRDRHDDDPPPLLLVGFNRRFSPLTAEMKRHLDSVSEPKTLLATVNAGRIPADHWVHDPDVGGGRIVGEACHFIDLLRHLVGASISTVDTNHAETPTHDTATIQLSFEDGSIGTVLYVATGSKRFPKERVEAFGGDGVLQLDNFRTLRGYGWDGFKRERLWRQDKGHAAEIAAFIEAVRSGGPPPIPTDELLEVSYATLDAAGR